MAEAKNTVEVNQRVDWMMLKNPYPAGLPQLKECSLFGTDISEETSLAASTLGMCAERNAIANMITNGEHEIDKLVAVMEDGRVGSPCGTCREYMMQLSKGSGNIEILTDYESRKTVRLKELIPD